MEQNTRRYPVGIQTFSEIINGGYIYVDKTDLVWELAHYAKFIFLSRPRRFGKSLLSSTLHSYFAGDKELFNGLKIINMEKEWVQYPVLHFDLSAAKHLDKKGVEEEIRRQLLRLESVSGGEEKGTSIGMRLDGLVRRAYQKISKQVVIIIDEYDSPLLDVMHDSQRLHDMRELLQEFYQRLKMLEPYIKFCFITGITRFSQLSIFSTLNNLTNVSLLTKFSAICGITEKELHEQLGEDIKLLAEEYEYTEDETANKLKLRYDGYHFAGKSPEVYNPYSLLSAFANKHISNYWFETGTPTFLIRMMKQLHFNITNVDNIETTDYAINRPTEAMTSIIPLLYQTGYLTIKDYDREAEIYTLGIPNLEVRIGYTDGLLPAYAGLEGENVQTGFALKFWRALKASNIDLAMQHMQAYLAGIPYVEGFKKKLAEATTKEGFYEYTFYLIFSMLNVYARTQVKVANGRTDLVVLMPDTIYVMELKVDDSAQKALEQINAKGYATPYLTDGRKVVKVGVRFNTEKHTVDEWVVDELKK